MTDPWGPRVSMLPVAECDTDRLKAGFLEKLREAVGQPRENQIPCEAQALRAAQTPGEGLVQPYRGEVPCRMPFEDECLQVLGGDEWQCPVFMAQSRKRWVLIHPERPLGSQLKVQERVLRVAVNSLGNVFIWPALDSESPVARTQRGVIAAAEQGWAAVWREAAGWRFECSDLADPPRWPGESLPDLAEKAGLRPPAREGR